MYDSGAHNFICHDLVYMSCGKQMKLNISIEFYLPFLKYVLLLAIGSPLFRALLQCTLICMFEIYSRMLCTLLRQNAHVQKGNVLLSISCTLMICGHLIIFDIFRSNPSVQFLDMPGFPTIVRLDDESIKTILYTFATLSLKIFNFTRSSSFCRCL